MAAKVDRMFETLWDRKGLKPSGPCTDTEFLRRVHLYINGRVPIDSEVRSFLADNSREKRVKLINALIGMPEYAENWANIWCIRLVGRQTMLDDPELYFPLYDWMEMVLSQNEPYDRIVQELLSASGPTDRHGGAAFLARWADAPENAAGQVTRVFLGVRMQCAQCHDHPYEDVTQQSFWETAAFFQGLRAIRPNRQRGEKVWRLKQSGNGRLKIPDTDKTVMAKYVFADADPITKPAERRTVLGDLMTSKENPYFSLALVNWMWAQLLGQGMINPIDDMSFGNRLRPAHAEAYYMLALDFAKNGFDLARLTRIIMQTQVFQCSTQPNASNKYDSRFFSKATPRAMTPEQLMNSVAEIGGLNQLVSQSMSRGQTGDRYINQMRRQMRNFINLYDNDEMSEALDFQGSIPLALFLMNSDMAGSFLMYKDSPIRDIAESNMGMKTAVENLFYRVMSRPPTTAELQRFRTFINHHHDDRVAGFQDALWVMLNSTEFFYIE